MSRFAPFPEWTWEIPERFNIAVACLDAHLGTAAESRDAMIVEDDVLGTSQATYRELADRTGRFAQLLRNFGVGEGERVLIRLPNSLAYPTAFLGAMKRGAIKFEGEMLDPPMFGKALQTLLRAHALHALSKDDTEFAIEVIRKLPAQVIRENWPYGVIL